MTWRLAEFDDMAWAGPFPSREAILTAFEESLGQQGLSRDDDYGELVTMPLIRGGDRWWAGMPASLVRGPQCFRVELDYDPENEWGDPIGYSVHPVEERDGALHIGAAARTVRQDMHPDDGELDAALEEIGRRTGTPVDDTANEWEEVGVLFP